jgi:hypothetical protein
MFVIIYAICFVLVIVVMIALMLRHIKQEVKNEFHQYDNLKDKYPDIKADNFDPLLYLVIHHNVSYLDSDNVVFFKSISDVTHCMHFNGDINNLFIYSPHMVIVHIIQNKKSVNFKVSSPILPKIEIIEE